MILSAASKTFLVGEYSVLLGGSAIVLLSSPRFELYVKKKEATTKNTSKKNISGIDEHSPAYKFYQLHNVEFDNLSIEFFDPHNQSGGFGASSAQFALLYKLHMILSTNQQFDMNTFLREYKQLSTDESECRTIAPSGADCAAQYVDHNIFFDSATNVVEKNVMEKGERIEGVERVEKIDWNFQNLDYAVLKTKTKIATHSHLQHLHELNFTTMNIDKLQNAVINVKNSFFSGDEELLARNVQYFFELLKEKNLVIKETIKLVDKLLTIDGVKAAKGCGAMCADTIIIIFEKHKRQAIAKLLAKSFEEKIYFAY